MKRWLMTALLLAVAVNAQAQTGLETALAQISSLAGKFEQRVVDADGVQLEESSGSFKLLHPGYFYWAIETPDQQILIADGSTLIHYDADLETASERPIDAQQANSPLALFARQGKGIAEHYAISSDAADSYSLLPKQQAAGFTEARITLADGMPRTMEVMDALGNTTYLSFSEVSLNPAIDVAEFSFVAPDGVDFYRYER